MNYILSMCFMNPEVITRSLEQLHKTRTSNAQLVLVDQYYPLPDKEKNHEIVKELAKKYDAIYLDPGKNLGLSHGANFMLEQVGMKEDDLLLGFDPDCFPVTVGWDSALLKTLENPDIGWASLWNDVSAREMSERGFVDREERGLNLRRTLAPVINSVCGFRMDWVLACGGFFEQNLFYGGTEVHMWQRLVVAQKQWVFLRDFREERDTATSNAGDETYRLYKIAHAMQGYPGDFEQWLRERGEL